MKTKLMADSTCDLSQEILNRYNICLAPLVISIEGKEYRDRIDISNDEFYKNLMTFKSYPTTSMPSPESYIACIHEAVEQGYEKILCICMSSGTSGSYQGAILAKELYYEQNPKSNIQFEIIDSVSMSHGSGWLIMKCAMLIENGYTFEELIEYCETIKYRIKHFLSVDDLDSLIRSGRLSNARGVIGKLLNVKPIMSMKNTRGAVVAKKRGTRHVYNYYIQEFKNRVDYEQTNFVIIGYTSDINKAENLKALLLKIEFKGDIYIMQMGVAVGTHVGLGGLSMFFVEKPHEDFMRHMKEKIIKQIHS
ncbi:MAG: DegV family protein [Tissierellia bacterium]|nr:DegV family protein [Tissierellia bacterium]MDD4046969.1 DegV family protein [Tissierellia bacterium]MDD4678863.1 DegV family protein [Tissierellia bacterium]